MRDEKDQALARRFQDEAWTIGELIAAIRGEERGAAFQVLCPDCAEGDEPIYSKEARWFYHGISNQEVGCSASKLRIAALEDASENRKGEG